MDNYIIKGAGKAEEILTALKTIRAIYGGGCTLQELGTATRYASIKIEISRQINTQKQAEQQTDDENNRYFENLFKRQHELNAQTTTGAGR